MAKNRNNGAEEREDEATISVPWPVVKLDNIFRLRQYLESALRKRDFPVEGDSRPTFRAFVSKAPDVVKTHRHLVQIVDRIEANVGRLLITREYEVAKGRFRQITTKEQLNDTPAKLNPKRNGLPTPDGEAFRQFSLLVEELWDSMRTDLPAEFLEKHFENLRYEFSAAKAQHAKNATRLDDDDRAGEDEDGDDA